MLLPFDEGPFRLRMGVRPVALVDWIDADDRLAEQLELKRELLATRHSELVVLDDDPRTAAVCDELERRIVEWWAGRSDAPPDPGPRHPIERAALLTQEDWCVLDIRGDGPAVLVAACVCFPTRWILTEKLGAPVTAIHGPVAFYDEQLAGPVDRFIARLRPEAPVWRANWNLVDDPAWCQAYLPAADRRLRCTVDDVADRVWLRVERQTLRRLPDTGAVAFGIRVRQWPLRELPQGAATRRLSDAIRALPAETFAYKGLGAFWPELEEWLQARSRG